jgi:hypothetical protein
MRRLVLLSAFALLALPAGLAAQSLPGAATCPIFPSDNAWNQRVDRLPVAMHSTQMVAHIGLNAPVLPDFGSRAYRGEYPIGIPINVVRGNVRWVHVRFRWGRQSSRGLYPIPRHVQIQGGPHSSGDRHVIVVDASNCRDYELFHAAPLRRRGHWYAEAGAIYNLLSNRLRHAGYTSADAAGLPILPGLARYSEVASGVIDHALRFSAPCTASRYVYPARHYTRGCRGHFLPPMGLRLRLRANVNISGLPYQARVVAVALKQYGLIVADNGGPWEVSGAPDPRWNNAALKTLTRLTGRDFEVVDTRSLPHPGLRPPGIR